MSDEFDLTNTIIYNKQHGNIYFCADDLYGYYTMSQMFDIVRSMVTRLEAIMQEMKGNK